MNEFEIPRRDFDEILEFIVKVIRSYKVNMTPPRYHYLHRIELLTTVIDLLESIRSNSEKELSKQPNSDPRILPVHRGYTVDMNSREFRKVIPDNGLEFISFDSEKGETLLLSLVEERFEIIKQGIRFPF